MNNLEGAISQAIHSGKQKIYEHSCNSGNPNEFAINVGSDASLIVLIKVTLTRVEY